MEERLHTAIHCGTLCKKKPSPVAAVDLEEHCSEDEEDPDDSGGADGVGVDEAGEDDGHGLPPGHDDDEDDGAELGDGVVDEELAHGGANRQDHAVKGEDGVLELFLECV